MKQILIGACCLMALNSQAQDRLISFGYTKNFVSADSSNISLTIDLNRTPGKTESASGLYFISTDFFKIRNAVFYLKPTADVNIGSYTTNAPNNIVVGVPFGVSYLLPKFTKGDFYLTFENSPQLVSDKTLDSYIYYTAPGLNLSYSRTGTSEQNNVFDISVGARYAFGKRMQDVKTKVKNNYGKFMIPVFADLSLFLQKPKADTSKKDPEKRRKKKKEEFHLIKFSGVYKFNRIYNDDRIITPNPDRLYAQLKLDVFIIKQFGINFTYTAGYDEPLFKKSHSLAFGITFAR